MDRSRILALAIVSLTVCSAPGLAAAQSRAPLKLSVRTAADEHTAGDPLELLVELRNRGKRPTTIHFDRRSISFSLDPGTAREILCEPPPLAREAERREFVTVRPGQPHVVRVELMRHCPQFAAALSREGPHDLLAYYDARLDGWQFELEAWTGRLFSDPFEFILNPRFGLVTRGTSVSQRVLVYFDDDDTVVTMPHTAVSADVAAGLTVGASYMADIVSSASVDVVSAASGRLEERRDQIGIGASYGASDWRVSSAVTYSSEPDYRSETLQVGVSRELLERNVTLSGEYQLRRDRLGVNGDAELPHGAIAHRGRLDIVQLLGPRTFLQGGLSGSVEAGYLANPYRYVVVAGHRQLEVLPDTLLRAAVGLRLAHLLSRGQSARADYRFYVDGWGVTSHTAEARYALRISDLIIRLGYRLYVQSASDYYRSSYPQPQEYFTGDRELTSITSHTALLEASFWKDFDGAISRVSLELGGELGRYFYDDHPPLSSRTAAALQAAVGLRF